MTSPPKPTGSGSATFGGVDYQARAAAWAAVAILAGDLASTPWGLPTDHRLERLWSETNEPVDDLLIATSAGGFIFIQAKRRLDLGRSRDSPFVSAVRQCVRQFLAYSGSAPVERPWRRALEPARDRLVVAFGRDSSAPVRRDLPRVLERLRGLPSGTLEDGTRNNREEDAFAALRQTIETAWLEMLGQPPPLERLIAFLKLLRLDLLDVESGGSDETIAKDRLRQAVLAEPLAADSAWSELVVEGISLARSVSVYRPAQPSTRYA